MNSLDITFTPADFVSLKERDLGQAVCVVFDILRATTSMTAALANGAEAIIPVTEISEAVALHQKNPALLLAGERHGLRILKDQTGSVDFNLGNSPREFTADKVRGKTVAMTTTNGTRALRACVGAKTVFIGSFLNLRSLSTWLRQNKPTQLILVGAGTFEEAGYEDILAAGALADSVWDLYSDGHVTDSAQIGRQTYLAAKGDLAAAMQFSRNARRLLSNPDLRDDVPFSLRRDTVNLLAELKGDIIRRW